MENKALVADPVMDLPGAAELHGEEAGAPGKKAAYEDTATTLRVEKELRFLATQKADADAATGAALGRQAAAEANEEQILQRLEQLKAAKKQAARGLHRAETACEQAQQRAIKVAEDLGHTEAQLAGVLLEKAGKEAELEALRGQVDGVANRKAAADAELEALRKQVQDAALARDQLTFQAHRAAQTRDAAGAAFEQTLHVKRFLDTQVTANQHQLQQLLGEAQSAAAAVAFQRSRVEIVMGEADRAREAKERVDREIAGLLEQNSQARVTRERLNGAVARASAKLRSINASYAEHEEDVRRIRAERTTTELEVTAQAARLEEKQCLVHDAELELAEVQGRVHAAELQATNTAADIEAKAQELARHTSTVNTRAAEAEAVRARLRELELAQVAQEGRLRLLNERVERADRDEAERTTRLHQVQEQIRTTQLRSATAATEADILERDLEKLRLRNNATSEESLAEEQRVRQLYQEEREAARELQSVSVELARRQAALDAINQEYARATEALRERESKKDTGDPEEMADAVPRVTPKSTPDEDSVDADDAANPTGVSAGPGTSGTANANDVLVSETGSDDGTKLGPDTGGGTGPGLSSGDGGGTGPGSGTGLGSGTGAAAGAAGHAAAAGAEGAAAANADPAGAPGVRLSSGNLFSLNVGSDNMQDAFARGWAYVSESMSLRTPSRKKQHKQ